MGGLIRRWMTRHAPMAIVAALPLVASGCLALAAGAAGGAAVGFAYYKGEVFDKFNAGYAQTTAAVRSALKDLNMRVVKEEIRPGSTVIESRTKEDDVVVITVAPPKAAPPNPGAFTQVGVRVGFFGDSALCNQLFGRMDAYLSPVPGNRLVPQMQPALGPIQPVSAVAGPETPPPPLATK